MEVYFFLGELLPLLLHTEVKGFLVVALSAEDLGQSVVLVFTLQEEQLAVFYWA